MNRQQFLSFVEAPEKLGAESIAELNGVIHTFPYFQTAHLLYLKALHNQNSIHYSSRLKLTAAYATDRKVLYNLITGKPVVKPVVMPEPPVKAEEIPAPEPEQKTVEAVELPPSVEALPEEVPAVQEPVAEKKEERLDTDILAEIISTTAIDEIAELPVPQEEKKEEQVPEPADLSVLGSRSFAEWLSLTRKGTAAAEKTEMPGESLIDKFITSDPKIKPKKAEFYSPVNMARQSVKEDMTLVTETLAKVYMQQGSLVKARQAFENLSLKYPEKSRYFAAQIKIINEQLNSKK